MTEIKLYWWMGEGRTSEISRNFGDWMSPLICEAVSGRKCIYAEPAKADLMAIGSILKKTRRAGGVFRRRRLHIWGTGSIGEEGNYSSRAVYHAVRGQATLAKIPSADNVPLGDPGLLCHLLIAGESISKRFRVGLVPHYVDKDDAMLKQWLRDKRHVKVINVFDPVVDVIRQIASCEFVLSSSMHGLIVADALGIPNQWLKISSRVVGNDFKFFDYYSVYPNVQATAWGLSRIDDLDAFVDQSASVYKRVGITRIQSELIDSFPFS